MFKLQDLVDPTIVDPVILWCEGFNYITQNSNKEIVVFQNYPVLKTTMSGSFWFDPTMNYSNLVDISKYLADDYTSTILDIYNFAEVSLSEICYKYIEQLNHFHTEGFNYVAQDYDGDIKIFKFNPSHSHSKPNKVIWCDYEDEPKVVVNETLAQNYKNSVLQIWDLIDNKDDHIDNEILVQDYKDQIFDNNNTLNQIYDKHIVKLASFCRDDFKYLVQDSDGDVKLFKNSPNKTEIDGKLIWYDKYDESKFLGKEELTKDYNNLVIQFS